MAGRDEQRFSRRAGKDYLPSTTNKRRRLVSKGKRRAPLSESDDDFKNEQPAKAKRSTRSSVVDHPAKKPPPTKIKADPLAYFGAVKKTDPAPPIKSVVTAKQDKSKKRRQSSDEKEDLLKLDTDSQDLVEGVDFEDDFDIDNDKVMIDLTPVKSVKTTRTSLRAKDTKHSLDNDIDQNFNVTTNIKMSTPKKTTTPKKTAVSNDITESATPKKISSSKKALVTTIPIIVSPIKSNTAHASNQSASISKQADVTTSDNGKVDLTANAKSVQEPPSKKKFNPYIYANRPGPSALGTKEIPEGVENCLHGLTFVHSGELSSITREQTADLIKRHGGRVTSAVSSKTSYLIVGEGAGATKSKKAKDINVPIIGEDELFELIRTRPGVSNQTVSRKVLDKKGKKSSKETEPVTFEEVQKQVQAQQQKAKLTIDDKGLMIKDNALWTDKHTPTELSQLIGNKSHSDKLTSWLRGWDNARQTKFKFTGQNNTTHLRAALLSGPPGIGKTTMAHLASKLEGYDVLEFNASDARSKKSLDEAIQELIGNRTIGEFYHKVSANRNSKDTTKRQVIIMDEVDGMSAGDRGGMAELVKLIKTTKVPIICICNDRSSPKIRTLTNYCMELRFRRPDAGQIRCRLMTICYREGLNIKPEALDNLVTSTQADIRQIITILSTHRLQASTLNYDEAKQLGNASEKDITMGIFDIAKKYFDGYVFQRAPMYQKMEYYFIDYELAPLMIQENYLGVRPNAATAKSTPNARDIAVLDCLSKAADAIAVGSILDNSIRRHQAWGLMTAHAIYACVAPAYYMSGVASMFQFPSFLGNMSKTSKGYRLLKEISMHMRLRISGDKSEVRHTYIPVLATLLSKPLMTAEPDVVPMIEMMDSYFLSREDYDSMFELGVGDANGEVLLKAVPSAVKSKFTREWNKRSHPTPFPVVVGSKKGTTAGATGEDVPDMEEAHEVEAAVDEDNTQNINEDDDVATDKLIVQGGSKKTGTGRSKKAASSSTDAKGTRGRGRGRGRVKEAE